MTEAEAIITIVCAFIMCGFYVQDFLNPPRRDR